MVDADEVRFRRALGARLKAARIRLGLTRRELVDEMSRPISVRRLESWESGQRELNSFWYWRLCRRLGLDPGPPLHGAGVEVGVVDREDVPVALLAVAADRSPELAPLRAWAQQVLREGAPNVLRVPSYALAPLADLCGLPPHLLLRRLQALSPPRTGTDDD